MNRAKSRVQKTHNKLIQQCALDKKPMQFDTVNFHSDLLKTYFPKMPTPKPIQILKSERDMAVKSLVNTYNHYIGRINRYCDYHESLLQRELLKVEQYYENIIKQIYHQREQTKMILEQIIVSVKQELKEKTRKIAQKIERIKKNRNFIACQQQMIQLKKQQKFHVQHFEVEVNKASFVKHTLQKLILHFSNVNIHSNTLFTNHNKSHQQQLLRSNAQIDSIELVSSRQITDQNSLSTINHQDTHSSTNQELENKAPNAQPIEPKKEWEDILRCQESLQGYTGKPKKPKERKNEKNMLAVSCVISEKDQSCEDSFANQ